MHVAWKDARRYRRNRRVGGHSTESVLGRRPWLRDVGCCPRRGPGEVSTGVGCTGDGYRKTCTLEWTVTVRVRQRAKGL